MKQLIIVLLILPYILYSQINLEKTYLANNTKRVYFPSYGEKYYYLNSTNNSVEFYNADHTMWKTINLVLPANASNVWLFSVSEALLNTDDLLEVAYRFAQPSSVAPQVRIINESGTILANFINTSQFVVSELNGLPNKIITHAPTGNESIVFSLPSFSLEHHYIQGNINRINFSNAGEKYYLHDKTTNQIKLFNTNHSPWKTVNLPAPANMTNFSLRSISQTKINSDNLIDVIYAFRGQGSSYTEVRIANDTGHVIHSFPNTSNVALSQLGSLPPKIIRYDTDSTHIYALPSLVLEKSYLGQITRTQLDVSGEKYYRLSGNTVDLFNANHSSWKSFNLPFTPNGTSYITHLSQTQINPDTLIEIAYINQQNALGNVQYNGKVTTETGTILLDVSGAFSLVLSQIDSLDNKILAYMYLGNKTNVYGIYLGTPIVQIPYQTNNFSITPNPANTHLTIDNSSSLIQEVRLFDATGNLIKEISTSASKRSIDVSDLPNGIYLISCQGDEHKIYTNKVVIHH